MWGERGNFMKDKGLTIFIALLTLALVALGCLVAIGVIGDGAQAEANSIASGYRYSWSYIDWDNDYHYAIQYIDEIDGGASCSGYLEAHRWKTDEETGEDVCMLCGYVHQEEEPEGVKINTVNKDNSTAEDNLILPTGAVITTQPIRQIKYINTNEAVEGKFIVTNPCYTARWSATLINEDTVFDQIKYWNEENGIVTYEFIDAETGAVTFAHEDGFVIVECDASALDGTTENATPAAAIEEANAEETIIIVPETELRLAELEICLPDNDEEPGVASLLLRSDNSVAEDDVEIDALLIQPENLEIHFVKSCNVRQLLEKDLQMATSLLIVEDVPIVGEQNQDNG